MDLRALRDEKTISILFSAFLLLLAFAILGAGISHIHMQPDETLTYVTTERGFFEAVDFTLFHDVHAPLWFILAWLWQQFAGLGEFAGRYQSILISMLTLSIVYQIGRTGFRNKTFGWFALAMLSCNAYFIVYSLEIRPYPLVMLATALSYRFFLAWLEKRSMWSALFYGLSLSLLLYTHYFLAFVLLSQVIYFVFFKILDWKLVKQGFVAGLLGASLLMPQMLVLLYQLRFVKFTQGGTQGVPTSPSSFETIMELLNFATNGWSVLFLVIACLGLLRLWKNQAYRMSLVWFLIAPSLLIVANLRTPLLTSRYISYAAPAISLLVGFSLASWLSAKRLWRNALLWGLLIVLGVVCLYNLPAYLPVRIPFRNLFAEVNTLAAPDDVLFVNQWRENDFLGDQYERYLAAELRENRVGRIEEADTARRIWFVTDSVFSESYEAAFRELEATHRVERVIGDCTRAWCYVIQLMLAPPMREAVTFGDSLGYLGADIAAIGDNQMPVLLWWTVDETPQADYSISLQLLAEDGSLVSQVDRQIKPPEANIGEIPTSAMQPDASYIDLRLLAIPSDLGPGQYRLQLVVYQWWDGQRLFLEDGSDAYFIETIEITGDE